MREECEGGIERLCRYEGVRVQGRNREGVRMQGRNREGVRV